MDQAENGLRGRIRALILDYGEVLCRPPVPDKLLEMAQIAGLDLPTFTSRYHQERGQYDRGDLDPASYWSRVLPASVERGSEVFARLRQLDVEMWCDLNPDMIRWLEEARNAGFKTAVLSNMHADMASHARRHFDWLRALDCVVLSCEVRLIKPERDIYLHCVQSLDVPPGEACFIDDRMANVEGARHAGLVSFRFQTLEGLRNDLREIGFPVLPSAADNQQA